MCDLLAGLLTAFVEEGRQSARFMVSEPLALLAPALANQVSSTTILYVCDSKYAFQRMPGFAGRCTCRGTGGHGTGGH